MSSRAAAIMAATVLAAMVSCTQVQTIKSPDGKLAVNIDLQSRTYDLIYDGQTLMKGSEAQLTLADSSVAWPEKTSGAKISVKRSPKTVTEHIDAPFYRQASFDYSYNTLTISFPNGFSMEWRVSDDGAAYRFLTTRDGDLNITSETAEFRFADDWPMTVAKSGNLNWKTSFEGMYNTQPLSAGGIDSLCFMPASIACGPQTDDGALRVTITESAVIDFPGSFLIPVAGEPAVRILHAPLPDIPQAAAQNAPAAITAAVQAQAQAQTAPAASQTATQAPAAEPQPIIAITTGPCSYPWRILKVTTRDADIPVDNLVYALAEPNRIGDDLGWIHPGYSAWEWWNDWGLEGTNFKPGINDQTYRAYIDFAAANGLEYVLFDEGWGKRGPGQNLLTPIPELHLQELSEYAQSKGVRLVLWAVFDRVAKDAENVFSTYEPMGIAGFKPDFLNRNDQAAIQQICMVAEAAARHHMFIDFHGIFPPMGLNRTYPNILNMEGIAGLEQCKWQAKKVDFMKHDCTLSYLRTMAGISDYTPGAMTNYGDSTQFVSDYSHPGSKGTRAHQVALYGMFDSPFTMLCDSPSAYERNQQTTDFIASFPRDYVSKKAISGTLGDYLVVAREAADGGWYVFGITNYTARTLDVPLSFLDDAAWRAQIFRDDDSAHIAPDAAQTRAAERYILQTLPVSAADTLSIPLAPGGGFAIKLAKH